MRWPIAGSASSWSKEWTANPRTPALLFDTLGEVTKLAATYDQSVYLVTNSKPTRN